ncbi:MAG: hypothetical protein JW833_00375, partial [Prolixibacteraceae bacterium]|nr:hypothetical protein [Prolixibacteraceae bacterium]
MNKIKLSCLIITLILLSGAVRGSNSDSIGLHSFNTFKMLRINNYWLETGNIAGISFNKVNSAGIVESGYSILDGEFHRMREATEKKNFYLETESYQKIKNIDFYGSFSYTNSDEKGILWNGVFDPYRGNPYIVGDSVPGATYHKETYRIQGGLAKKLNNKLTIGL